jgi:hypothetical protein
MCIARDATLMFHGGHDIQEDITGPDTRASRAMLYRYNEALGGTCAKGITWTATNTIR